MTDTRDSWQAGNELLRALAAMLPPEFDVREDRMFNGRGLKTGDRFFAFVTTTGLLVVKLPAAEIESLTSRGDASVVTMGKRTMREWVSIAQPGDGETSRWRDPLEAALRYVSG